MSPLSREWRLLRRDRGALLWIAVTFLAALFAVVTGVAEQRRQVAEIDALIIADATDRNAMLAKQEDWGSAAYYAFHLTYDPPAPASFMTQGERDSYPWKHRVRMLALEGQIYEADVGSPTVALIGRFDLAFMAAVLLPLLLIVLLYDLRSSEADAGRLDLLEATASTGGFWRTRGLLRAGLLTLALIAPLLLGGVAVGTSAFGLLAAVLLIVAHAAFWTWLVLTLGAWRKPTPVLLATLLGGWLLLAVVVPLLGRTVIDQSVTFPPLAEIALEQRETVNDAWDLPKAATMDAFVARHPDWTEHAKIDGPFEWKWYYAFQQVGDQAVEPLSRAYRDGLRRREDQLDRLSWLSPPMLVTRSLQRLSNSDLRALLAYDGRVRDFHQRLREFHYPKLFLDEPFSPEAAESLPAFAATAEPQASSPTAAL
ncbi:MAG: DUF3526 domain-containing protein [Pseudomonadota bacterium]